MNNINSRYGTDPNVLKYGNKQYVLTGDNVDSVTQKIQEEDTRELQARLKRAENLVSSGKLTQITSLWNNVKKLEVNTPYSEILMRQPVSQRIKHIYEINSSLFDELKIVYACTEFLILYEKFCDLRLKFDAHQNVDIDLSDSDSLFFFYRFCNKLDMHTGISELKGKNHDDLKELIKISSGKLQEVAQQMLYKVKYAKLELELTKKFWKIECLLDEMGNSPKALSQLFYGSNLHHLNMGFTLNEKYVIKKEYTRDDLHYAVDLDLIEKMKGLLQDWATNNKENFSCFQAIAKEIVAKRPKNQREKLQYIKTYEHYPVFKENPSILFPANQKPFTERYSTALELTAKFISQSFSAPQLEREALPPQAQSSTAASSSCAETESITPSNEPIFSEVAPSNKSTRFNYTGRVLDWFRDQPQHLSNPATYGNLPLENKKFQHLLHGFSREVDSFVKELSYESTWDNYSTRSQDQMFSIPGKIIFGENELWGAFTYATGDNGLTYHRYFKAYAPERLMQLTGRKFQDPSIKLDVADLEPQTSERYVPPHSRSKVSKHRIFGSIHIEDAVHGATLILMPKN